MLCDNSLLRGPIEHPAPIDVQVLTQYLQVGMYLETDLKELVKVT